MPRKIEDRSEAHTDEQNGTQSNDDTGQDRANFGENELRAGRTTRKHQANSADAVFSSNDSASQNNDQQQANALRNTASKTWSHCIS